MRQILMAAFNVVHDHGTDCIAELLCKTRGSVCHEVNPPVGSQAKLGILDAAKITVYTKDDRILRAMAEVCGCMLVPMVELPDADADVSGILNKCSKMAEGFAGTLGTINGALVDGKVTQNERDQVLKISDELVSVINQVRTLVIAKADADSSTKLPR